MSRSLTPTNIGGSSSVNQPAIKYQQRELMVSIEARFQTMTGSFQSQPQVHTLKEQEKREKVARRRSCKSSGFKTIRHVLKSAGPSFKNFSNFNFIENIKESQIVTFGTSGCHTHREEGQIPTLQRTELETIDF